MNVDAAVCRLLDVGAREVSRIWYAVDRRDRQTTATLAASVLLTPVVRPNPPRPVRCCATCGAAA